MQTEVAMSDFSSGKIEQPVRKKMEVKAHNGSAAMMPCWSQDGGLSCKLLYLLPDNWSKYRKSTHVVYMLLFDQNSGKIKALMQGEGVTERRTAATSALASRWLRPMMTPQILAVLGAGVQGRSHIQVLTHMYPSIKEVRIWNRTDSTAESLGAEVSGWVSAGTAVRCERSVEGCVKDADIIVTATFAKEPILLPHHIATNDRVLVLAVGAVAPKLSELAPEILVSDSTFLAADSRAAAAEESGDVIKSGAVVRAELGDIIGDDNEKVGQKESVLIYKSLGLAVQDLVAAQMIFDQHESRRSDDFPCPYLARKDVEGAVDLAESDHEECDETRAEVSGLGVKAAVIGQKFILFSVQTAACHVGIVLSARTGDLLGILELGDSTEGLKKKNCLQILFE